MYFYMKCQSKRNQIYHDLILQRERLIKWANNLLRNVKNQNLQAAKYTSEYKIKFNTASLKNIKKQIYIIQKLYVNVRDYKENDI